MKGKFLKKMLIRTTCMLWLSLIVSVVTADELNQTTQPVTSTPTVVAFTASSTDRSSSGPGSPPTTAPSTTARASKPTTKAPSSTPVPTTALTSGPKTTATPSGTPVSTTEKSSPKGGSLSTDQLNTTSTVVITTPALNNGSSTNQTVTKSPPTATPTNASSITPSTTSTPHTVTRNPTNSSNTTLPPATTVTTNNSTNVPSATPATSTASTEAPTMTSTVAPQTTSTNSSIPSTSTLPPATPPPTQVNPGTTVTTPENTANTTVTAQTNTTVINTSTPDATGTSEGQTSTPPGKTSTGATQEMPSTVPPGPGSKEVIYINEVLVDKDGQIQKIELYLSDNFNVTKYAMVMVDGSNNKYTSLTYLKNVIRGDNNLMIVSFSDNVPIMQKQGVGIAIYNTDQIQGGLTGDWTASTVGLVDALVIGKTYEETSETLIQVLTPGAYPFVVNPSLYGQQKSISRCSSDLVCDSSMFALINPSLGLYNKDRCHELLVNQKAFSLKLHADCDLLRYPNKTIDSKKLKLVMRHILREVNKKCRCGITEMHVTDPPSMQCCGDLTLNMKFGAPNLQQEEDFLSSYKSYVQATSSISVDQNMYTVDNGCYSYCCKGPLPATEKDSSNQVKVTVAVVVSCLIVFMIIVIILVMYMRRKKSAVYQFRMSRLTEEDDDLNVDGPDCDDFVGGQEATFDLKR